MDHAEEARRHLEAAEAGTPVEHIAVAAVHAILHVGDAIRHGLRDIIYELRS